VFAGHYPADFQTPGQRQLRHRCNILERESLDKE
jgi:hypothetical protein